MHEEMKRELVIPHDMAEALVRHGESLINCLECFKDDRCLQSERPETDAEIQVLQDVLDCLAPQINVK